MNFKSINDLDNIVGQKIIIRVDWNVPIENGQVRDDYRIRKSLPTIEHLGRLGSKMILISHIDEKEGGSLKPVFEHLKSTLPLKFSEQIWGDEVKEMAHALEEGEILLLENIRKDKGEVENSEDLAKSLASLGEIYVNEAFSESHRSYASIVGIPKFLNSFGGLLFAEEVTNLSKIFSPKKPFLFILAGAKFDTKLPLIEKFVDIADEIFVGGALANNFFQAMNLEIGNSLVAEGDFRLKEMIASNKIKLPIDVMVKREGKSHIVSQDQVEPGDVIVDCGPNTILYLKERITKASSILWNGPLGEYENGYKLYTLDLASFIANSGKDTVIGGGDTLAAVRELNLVDKFTFVSTGGGAMLDFLANGTLPGIEVLKDKI
jgi:phosphoglycerate kinase